jgi:excisionase family DNA binding protein
MSLPVEHASPHELTLGKRRARQSQATSSLPRPVAWTVNDGARLLNVSRSTVYALARARKLRLIRLAGRTLIPDSEIARLGADGA